MNEKPSETIRITCPGCGMVATIPDEGDRVTRIRCGACKTLFTITDHSGDQEAREREWMLADEDEGILIL